jgi:hypothetical protein
VRAGCAGLAEPVLWAGRARHAVRAGWLAGCGCCIPWPPAGCALPLPLPVPPLTFPPSAPFHPHFPTRPQVIAQLELWNERESGKYEKRGYVLPKHLDEKVAALHLPKLGAKLTVLSVDQAAYINVPVGGPYKPAHYRCEPGSVSERPGGRHEPPGGRVSRFSNIWSIVWDHFVYRHLCAAY